MFADSSEDSLLLSLSIASASTEELEQMVTVRSLPVGTEEEMRKSLYDAYSIQEIDVATENDSVAKDSYTLSIVHADSAINLVGDSSLVVLDGNAVVEFSMADTDKPKILTANKMIIDLKHTRLSAFGSVLYQDNSQNAPVQEITGAIVTLNWDSQALSVSGGTTSTERKNSDGDAVSFYTSGDQITYSGSDSGIFFDNGFITTNKDDAYSSLTAKKLSMLKGGDILMNNAYLSIGRVPVFWLPFFFFPGSTMVGNPAMGITSDRGMFVNTTFEIFGQYPEIKASSQNSFTSLLANTDSSEKTKDGPLYRDLVKDEKVNDLEDWAKKSSSYLALFADSYEDSGISLGLNTQENFYDKKITVYSDLRFAVHPKGEDTLSSYSSFPVSRYFSESKFNIDTSWADVSLLLPFYSDPKVKRVYGNRLTSFSIDSLFGTNQEFPTDYTSDITSYTWIAKGTFNIPVSSLSPFISSLNITTLDASINYTWQKVDGEYGYFIDSITLPEINATMEGTLFSFERNLASNTSDIKKTTSKNTYEKQLGLAKKRLSSNASSFTYDSEVPLDAPYRTEESQKLNTASRTEKKQSISLGYTVGEKYYYTAEATDGYISDWESTKEVYNLTNGTIKLAVQAHPDYFTFSQTFTPKLTSKQDMSKTIYLTEGLYLSATTTASIPILGLTYSLNERLYSYTASYSDDGTDPEIESSSFEWTKEFVTTHQIKMEQTFFFPNGSFKPSITATLPPLDSVLLPAFTYKVGNWQFTDSFKFKENTSGILSGNLITSTLGYTSDFFTTLLTGKYQLSEYVDSYWEPFDLTGNATLKVWGKNIVLKENFVFEALSSSGDANYFSTLKTTLEFPFAKTSLDFLGSYGALELSTWDTNIVLSDVSFYYWKNRVKVNLGLNAALSINFLDIYDTSFSISAKIGFSIAEFLDFNFSVTSANTGFYSYYTNNVFSFSSMLEDLGRSFDFFGSGRTSTQFNMSSITAEVTHYMADWSLNCKYKGSVVLSNNQYSWVPVISVYLQWKTIPELKVDENWTKNSETWSSTSTT
ncbi:hypothetical protein [uncultured Sphaerochaeta sp.]|uniref:hypothetical protein n=1 Tax=uncultured Sphaerochaeta sp. TaxID=886478 RepID=UPI002A0A3FCF|nr:hypothetical protein [uncultured Sphaerochaeta sp.]